MDSEATGLRGQFSAEFFTRPSLRGQNYPNEMLRILERRILNLLVRIASLVVAHVMRADVFAARPFGQLSLVLKAAEERHSDALLKVGTREARN